jgi:hypothetical protein
VPTTEQKQDTTLRANSQPQAVAHGRVASAAAPANAEAGFAMRFVAAVEGFRRAQASHLN